jgi:LuxR family maltose regulon positive regulatory protein
MIPTRRFTDDPGLATPSGPMSHLTRPTLLRRLNSAVPFRVAALIAPAGFGKTTLAEDWIRTQDSGVASSTAWFAINERHSDPVRFWTSLASVVGQIGASIDERDHEELRSDPTSADEFSAIIADTLARLDQERILVLDDLDRISDRSLLAAIYRFVETLPRNVTLVVTSRTTPGWPLARMRARDEAVLLTAKDLVFSHAETAAVLEDVLDSPAAISVVHEQTGGWPVVVQLAAQSMRQSEYPLAVVDELSGTTSRVASYLVEEILDKLRPELRRFLLDMAVVDKFSVPLARALTGSSASALVDELLLRHLFVEPDERVLLYGPHPLVRDLLLDELVATDPDRIPLLHGKAGAWYRAEGAVSKAVEHLIAARAFDAALQLLDDAIEPHIVAGETATVLHWLELLPIEELERRPMAAHQMARALIEAARFDEAYGWLELAARGAVSHRQQADITETRMHLAYRRGAVGLVEQYVQALGALAEEADSADDQAAIRAHQIHGVGILASCFDAMGQDTKRRQADADFHAGRAAATPLIASSHESRTARFDAEDGELDRAQQRARWVLQTADRRGHGRLQSNAYSHLALARVAWCRGSLEAAEASLLEAGRLERRNSVYLSTARGLLAAEVHASLGRHDRSDEIQSSMLERHGSATITAELRSWTAAWAMSTCAAHGRLLEARRWLGYIERLGHAEHLSPPHRAQALALNEEHERLVETLGQRGQLMPRQPLPWLRCALILQPTLGTLGYLAEADDLTRQIIELAQHREIVQPLVDQPAVARHYRESGTDPSLRAFADYVSNRAENRTQSPAPALEQALIEGLTARELDVIHRLPTRLTNAEIASELNVALNTIKSHLRNIYRKLDVRSRDDAIVRLRELGML